MVSSKLAVKGLNFMVRNANGELGNSLLCLKPRKIPKIVPQELGYIRPDGKINFQTEQATLKYIKNRLLDSLKRPTEQQFERVIARRGTTILGQGDGIHGDATSAFQKIPGMLERAEQDVPRDVEVWHSHPDMFGKGRATPLSGASLGDIRTFIELKLKKIVAMNSNGEINSIEATKDLTPQSYKAFCDDMLDFEISSILPKDLWARYKELDRISTGYLIKGKKTPKKIAEEKKQISQIWHGAYRKIHGTETIAKIEHAFYTRAPKYGLKYFTNFSNLKD